ncbi:MAG: bacillithiol biosynthesis deacetylase BshB1 [Candidatus Heimdallarchaeota archaeon]
MLDVLVFGPHPDDAELGCGGAIVKATKKGLAVGIVDLTGGEMGTKGDKKTRLQEAQKAKEILGANFRENLDFPDGYVGMGEKEEYILKITNKIREHKPKIVLAPYWDDRHPDHIVASQMIAKACHYAKLKKLKLDHPIHKIKQILYYEINGQFTPTFIMDISEEFATKKEAIMAHKSQFEAFTKEFLPFPLVERCLHYGSLIGVKYGESYYQKNPLKIKDWESLL